MSLSTAELVSICVVLGILLLVSIFICVRCWTPITEAASGANKRRQSFVRSFRNSVRHSFRRLRNWGSSPHPPPRRSQAASNGPDTPEVNTVERGLPPYMSASTASPSESRDRPAAPPSYTEAIREQSKHLEHLNGGYHHLTRGRPPSYENPLTAPQDFWRHSGRSLPPPQGLPPAPGDFLVGGEAPPARNSPGQHDSPLEGVHTRQHNDRQSGRSEDLAPILPYSVQHDLRHSGRYENPISHADSQFYPTQSFTDGETQRLSGRSDKSRPVLAYDNKAVDIADGYHAQFARWYESGTGPQRHSDRSTGYNPEADPHRRLSERYIGFPSGYLEQPRLSIDNASSPRSSGRQGILDNTVTDSDLSFTTLHRHSGHGEIANHAQPKKEYFCEPRSFTEIFEQVPKGFPRAREVGNTRIVHDRNASYLKSVDKSLSDDENDSRFVDNSQTTRNDSVAGSRNVSFDLPAHEGTDRSYTPSSPKRESPETAGPPLSFNSQSVLPSQYYNTQSSVRGVILGVTGVSKSSFDHTAGSHNKDLGPKEDAEGPLHSTPNSKVPVSGGSPQTKTAPGPIPGNNKSGIPITDWDPRYVASISTSTEEHAVPRRLSSERSGAGSRMTDNPRPDGQAMLHTDGVNVPNILDLNTSSSDAQAATSGSTSKTADTHSAKPLTTHDANHTIAVYSPSAKSPVVLPVSACFDFDQLGNDDLQSEKSFQERYIGDEGDEGGFLAMRKSKQPRTLLFEHKPESVVRSADDPIKNLIPQKLAKFSKGKENRGIAKSRGTQNAKGKLKEAPHSDSEAVIPSSLPHPQGSKTLPTRTKKKAAAKESKQKQKNGGVHVHSNSDTTGLGYFVTLDPNRNAQIRGSKTSTAYTLNTSTSSADRHTLVSDTDTDTTLQSRPIRNHVIPIGGLVTGRHMTANGGHMTPRSKRDWNYNNWYERPFAYSAGHAFSVDGLDRLGINRRDYINSGYYTLAGTKTKWRSAYGAVYPDAVDYGSFKEARRTEVANPRPLSMHSGITFPDRERLYLQSDTYI